MKIIMDDAGDIPAELIEQYGVTIIPINIAFGTEEYLSGVNMDLPAFYQKAASVTAANFPKTSQPTPYQFVECYKSVMATGADEILTVTVGEKLSGTYESAVLAAQELDGQASFHIFDSQGGAATQGMIALEAARMAHEGQSIERIVPKLEKMRREQVVAFTIDSLEYAVKGGRVSSVKSLMASLLNIKPILKLDDGLIVEAGRVRTRKRALTHIVDYVAERVGDKPVKTAVMHANAPEDAQKLLAIAKSKLNVSTEPIVADMSVAVAINLGPGALGIVAFPD